MTALWALWRLQRFELAAVSIGTILLVAVAGFLVLRLSGFSSDPQCLAAFTGEGTPSDLDRCPGLIEYLALQSSLVRYAFVALGLAPLLVAVLIGAPTIAREVDQRTAELSWAVATSRARWLAGRAGPVLVLVVLVTAILAITGDVLEGARTPLLDPGNSFLDYGSRSWVLVSRGLAVVSIALLVGAMVGRLLPTIVIALVLGGAILVAAPVQRRFSKPRVAITVEWESVKGP